MTPNEQKYFIKTWGVQRTKGFWRYVLWHGVFFAGFFYLFMCLTELPDYPFLEAFFGKRGLRWLVAAIVTGFASAALTYFTQERIWRKLMRESDEQHAAE